MVFVVLFWDEIISSWKIVLILWKLFNEFHEIIISPNVKPHYILTLKIQNVKNTYPQFSSLEAVYFKLCKSFYEYKSPSVCLSVCFLVLPYASLGFFKVYWSLMRFLSALTIRIFKANYMLKSFLSKDKALEVVVPIFCVLSEHWLAAVFSTNVWP